VAEKPLPDPVIHPAIQKPLRERVPLVGVFFRAARVYREEGWPGVALRLRRMERRWTGPFRARRRTIALIREVGRSPRTPVVLASTVDWNILLFQRPQQLARAFAQLGRPCLYVTPNKSDDISGSATVEENCYLLERLDLAISHLDRFVLIVLSPTPRGLDFRRIRAARGKMTLVYDYIDVIHPQVYDLSRHRVEYHEEMIRSADLVSVTARSLFDEVRGRRAGPCILCPNAADTRHYRLDRKPPVPEEMKRAVDGARPILGYFGALARWFDYDLIHEIAARRPGWQVVLLGWEYDGSLPASEILKIPGVHYLGGKPYAALPAYAAHFDVAILPFVRNEVTESTSPIKLFEYMAARKPIVATDLPECRKYRSVLIGRDPGEFVDKVDLALTLRSNAEYLATLDREADENTWLRRAQQILDAADATPHRAAAGGEGRVER